MYKINVAHRWMGLAAGVALILALVLWWPGQVRASGAPDAPTDLSGAVVSEGIELEWVAPAGDVTGYQILRRRPEEGEKSLTVYEQDTGTTGTVYTDTAVKDEVRYVYRVRSLDEGQQSDPSNFVNIRWEEPQPPGPPSNLEGENTALGVALTWQAPTGDEEVTGYQLLRRRPDDDGSKLTDYASTTGSDATSYTDIMVEEGTRYVYRVRAVNEHGESAKSQFINIVRRMPAPGVPTALAAASGADGVELTWEKPTGGGTLSGYEVLRRIPARDETDLVLQATIPESDVTLYVDENVEDGVKYIYRVRGIRGSVMGPISNRAVVRWEEPAEPESEEEPEQAESQPASEDDDDPVVFVAVPDMGMLVTFAMDPEPILEENGRDIAIGFSNVEPGKVHNIQFMAYDDDKATRSCLGSGLEGGLALNLGTWTETYTHDVEIATTCPVGMYELVVAWTIGTDVVGGAVVHKFEVIENPDAGTEEDDPSLEYTDYVVPVRPTPAATHGPMLVGFVHSPAFTAGRTVHVGFGVGGLEFDDDVETTDYVVSFRVVDKDNQLAPECGGESLGGSYLLKTVKHHGMWARNFVISGSCTAGGGTAKLRMELLNGNHEYLGQFELTVR